MSLTRVELYGNWEIHNSRPCTEITPDIVDRILALNHYLATLFDILSYLSHVIPY
jgi:hypothetical protein